MGIGLRAAYAPGEPCTCQECGHEWPQDPCYEVACPRCNAKAGQYCKRDSGHQGPFIDFHAARDLAADKAGHYKHECKKKHRVSERQSELF